MFSQAGSASDGVAWISSLLTAFLRWRFLLLRRTDAFTKRGQKDAYADGTLVIVYYSPVWTDKEGKYLQIWCFLRGTCVLQPGDPSSRQNDGNVDRKAEPDAGGGLRQRGK